MARWPLNPRMALVLAVLLTLVSPNHTEARTFFNRTGDMDQSGTGSRSISTSRSATESDIPFQDNEGDMDQPGSGSRSTSISRSATESDTAFQDNEVPAPRDPCSPGWTSDFCDKASCYTEEPQFHMEQIEDRLPFGEGPNRGMPYCLFGGQCTITNSSSLPNCTCTPGQSGVRCLDNHTVVTKVSPTVGPQSGGTDISVYGYNLNGTRQPQVRLGKINCPTKFANNTLIVCTTLRITDRHLNEPLRIRVRYRDGSTLKGILDERFTYVEDPTILSVHPLYTISSGGVTLNVTGTGLDSVGRPILQITATYYGVPIHVFESPCKVNSPTQMQCPTPKLDIFNSDGQLDIEVIPPPTTEYPPYYAGPASRRRRTLQEPMKVNSATLREAARSVGSWRYKLGSGLHRQRRQVTEPKTKAADTKINSRNLEFTIGFRLDGVPTFRNLTESLPECASMSVYTDPVIDAWDEEQEIRAGRYTLVVKGERLTVGIQSTDYRMLIGQTECTHLEVYNNKLIGTAPEEMPDPHPQDTVAGRFTVMIHIGVLKEPFHVGSVKYCISFWDNPMNKWLVIGACILGGLIITVIIAVYIAHKTTTIAKPI